MSRRLTIPGLILLALVMLVVSVGLGQRYRRRTFDLSDPELRNGVPLWELDEAFRREAFTFVRIQYTSDSDYYGRGKWLTDYPDSDLNFAYRLQQLTSLDADPVGKVLRLTDPELFDYPWIYIIEPGDMFLTEPEVEGLRRYLEQGGFLMVDDFWGEDEWRVFYSQIKRVFPHREPEEVPLEHEIFHCVYDLNEKPQVPSINAALNGFSTERADAERANYRAIYDDKGRMMVFICHNTDLGDGWEREGENAWYFREFSEKRAYPLGINIVVYAMTH